VGVPSQGWEQNRAGGRMDQGNIQGGGLLLAQDDGPDSATRGRARDLRHDAA